MEATTKDRASTARPSQPDPNDPASGLPEGAPESLADAARGEEIDGKDEYQALDFVLGPTTPLEFDIDAKVETPKGLRKLTFHVRQLENVASIEAEYRKDTGDPFAAVDLEGLNAAIVARATLYIQDASGRKIKPTDAAFLGEGDEVIPDPDIAMKVRFKYQPGILSGIAREVRQVGGWGGDRVESAERSIREAVGNS